MIFVLQSCVTKRKRGEASFLGKTYHNITAHYNGYFNANELLKNSITKLNEEHQDNYNQILKLYEYTDVENALSVNADMDNAIKKSTVVINIHRPSSWMDDCYLLIGKCQYVKQDYEAAEETLRFLTDEYSPSKLKKKGKSGKALAKANQAERKEKAKETKKERDAAKKEKAEAREALKIEKEEAREQLQKEKEELRKEKEKLRKQQQKDKKKLAKQKAKQKAKDKKKKVKEKTLPTPEPTQPPAPEIENETAPTTKPPTIKPTTVITQKVEEVEDDDVAVDDDENIATLNDSDSTNVNLKKKNKPDRYFLKRPPAYYEGMLWLARTFIERQKFEEAQITLNTLSEDRKTRKSVRRQIPTVQAYYYLKQKRYEDAVKPLESAIKTARSKKDKARYHYILAQLHSLAGRQEAAYASFDKAQRMTNNYEMGFSAKLNKVLSAYHAGKQSSDDAISTLTKMTKDSKNKENKDQIYFALANIALKENNNTLAIENLKNSLLYNTANKSQKGESYLKLANLYYEQEDYINAKNYFDSTLLILSPADERYAEAGRNALNLKEIAENLSEIKLQDSLLAINKLSDKEKFALAQKMKDEQQKAEAATSKPADVSSFQPNDPISANIKPSQFFAYSDKALRKGRTEFTSIWGSRTLEDNWRRSNKRGGQEIAIANNVEEQETKSSLTKEEVDLILKDVPNTDAEIKTANDNIMTAMFNLGKLYRDKLQSNKKSIDILEKLIERYPGTTNELDAFYYLYLANTELPNAVRAEYYKNQIILRYPSTTYAKILLDPNFLAAARTKEQELNKYYNETYQIFNKGEYQNAFERIAAANERYGTQHTLQPKFLLLNAMCIGNLKGKDAYIKGLKDVITRYPETEEQRRAKEILRLLEGDKPDTLAEKSGNITEITKFKREDDKLHYIIIVMQNDDNIDKVKSAIADYNRRFYESEQLKMSNIYLNFEAKVKQPIIILRKFDNKEKGMKYYNGVKSNPTAFLQGYTYEIFTVTQENYRVLLQDKSVEEYRNYFSENYLK